MRLRQLLYHSEERGGWVVWVEEAHGQYLPSRLVLPGVRAASGWWLLLPCGLSSEGTPCCSALFSAAVTAGRERTSDTFQSCSSLHYVKRNTFSLLAVEITLVFDKANSFGMEAP